MYMQGRESTTTEVLQALNNALEHQNTRVHLHPYQ